MHPLLQIMACYSEKRKFFLLIMTPLGLFTSRGGCKAFNLLLVIRATAAEVYVTRPFAKTYA